MESTSPLPTATPEGAKHFFSKMSLDDCGRFQKLSNLYSELAMSEEGEIFSCGFTVGALLVMDMLDEVEHMKIEQ